MNMYGQFASSLVYQSCGVRLFKHHEPIYRFAGEFQLVSEAFPYWATSSQNHVPGLLSPSSTI
jgi:hypothetical protein